MVTDEPLRAILVVLVHLALAGVGIWLIVIDARTHRLPNRIVLPTLGALVALSLLDALTTGAWGVCGRALLSGLLLSALYAVLRGISGGGVGGGDVKLAAAIGVLLGWHGWQALLLGSAAAFVLGALFALILMALRRATKSTRIAFGPWMILGAAIGIALS